MGQVTTSQDDLFMSPQPFQTVTENVVPDVQSDLTMNSQPDLTNNSQDTMGVDNVQNGLNTNSQESLFLSPQLPTPQINADVVPEDAQQVDPQTAADALVNGLVNVEPVVENNEPVVEIDPTEEQNLSADTTDSNSLVPPQGGQNDCLNACPSGGMDVGNKLCVVNGSACGLCGSLGVQLCVDDSQSNMNGDSQVNSQQNL